MINHKYLPGLLQLTGLAHQHIVNTVIQSIATRIICGDSQRFPLPLSHRQDVVLLCMKKTASITCNLPETSTSPKPVCILFCEIRPSLLHLSVMAMSSSHKLPDLLSISYLSNKSLLKSVALELRSWNLKHGFKSYFCHCMTFGKLLIFSGPHFPHG